MTQKSFLSEILARIAVAGRRWTHTAEDTAASLISLCHSLVRNVSEAEGLKISHQILDIFTAAGAAVKAAFFSAVSREFGPNDTALSERGENYLPQDDCAAKLAARVLTEAQKSSGSAADPVAHFHLGNGAILLHAHPCADQSPRGIANSWGVMVNYLHDGEAIEQNHQANESHQDVSASLNIVALSKG